MRTQRIIKALTISGLAFLLSHSSLAQTVTTPAIADYQDAVGLRFGGTTGISYKHKFSAYNALEVIGGTYPHAVGITGLYERYILTNVDGLSFYFGAGGHISRGYVSAWGYTYNADKDQYYYYSRNFHYGPIVGVDAIGGMEYKLQHAPVAFSFDLKPYAEFYKRYRSCRLDPGLGIKFTF